MRWILMTAVLALAGCQNLIGPFQHRTPERVDDPMLPTDEQERRGRDRLPLPQDSPLIAPSTETYPGWGTRPGDASGVWGR